MLAITTISQLSCLSPGLAFTAVHQHQYTHSANMACISARSHRGIASSGARQPPLLSTTPCTNRQQPAFTRGGSTQPHVQAAIAPVHQGRWAGQAMQHSRLRVRPSAGAYDVMPMWTLDQIAGLVFGAVMVAAVFSSKFIDSYVAKSQRKQLGLCEECGGLFDPATCSQASCPRKKASSS